ncbi:MAG: hypothetical protein FWC83_01035 [Alphaproteobacteria bacterium]|nr:hypothetical protein [Alphaproteobacteria bacterium]
MPEGIIGQSITVEKSPLTAIIKKPKPKNVKPVSLKTRKAVGVKKVPEVHITNKELKNIVEDVVNSPSTHDVKNIVIVQKKKKRVCPKKAARTKSRQIKDKVDTAEKHLRTKVQAKQTKTKIKYNRETVEFNGKEFEVYVPFMVAYTVNKPKKAIHKNRGDSKIVPASIELPKIGVVWKSETVKTAKATGTTPVEFDKHYGMAEVVKGLNYATGDAVELYQAIYSALVEHYQPLASKSSSSDFIAELRAGLIVFEPDPKAKAKAEAKAKADGEAPYLLSDAEIEALKEKADRKGTVRGLSIVKTAKGVIVRPSK